VVDNNSEGVKVLKIICNCGNMTELKVVDEKEEFNEDEGQHARVTPNTFSFWESHDQVGVVCDKCKKSVYIFT
jgi:hypothetical protein